MPLPPTCWLTWFFNYILFAKICNLRQGSDQTIEVFFAFKDGEDAFHRKDYVSRCG